MVGKIYLTLVMKTIDTKEETLLCEDTGSIAAFKTTVKFEEGTKEFSIRFYKDEETEVSYEYRFYVEENKVVFNKCPNYPWYQCFNIGLERPIKLEADKEYENLSDHRPGYFNIIY